MPLIRLRRRRGRRRAEHGQPPEPGRPRGGHRSPSPDAIWRLAGGVTRELDQLRADVAEELVLARLWLNAGHLEEASGIFDEQSARLHRFQDHLEATIAAAVVERAAEEIFASAAETSESVDIDPEPSAAEGAPATFRVDSEAAAPKRTPWPRLGALAAAVSLVALIAAASVTGGRLSGLAELMAGRSRGPSPAAANGDEETDPVGDASPKPAPEAVSPSALEGMLDDAEAPEILRLLGRPGSILARFAEGTGNAPFAALLGVDRLVAHLVTEVAPRLPPVPAAEPPQAEPPPAPHQPAQLKAAPQPQPNPQPQPPVAGEPQSQPPQSQPAESQPAEPQPLLGEPAPTETPSVTEPAPHEATQPPAPAPQSASTEIPKGLEPRG